jgi:hypothetical protein
MPANSESEIIVTGDQCIGFPEGDFCVFRVIRADNGVAQFDGAFLF